MQRSDARGMAKSHERILVAVRNENNRIHPMSNVQSSKYLTKNLQPNFPIDRKASQAQF